MYSKEFFEQHKEKLYKHLDIFYDEKGLTKKRLNMLFEIYKDLSLYKDLIQKEIYKNIKEEDIQRVMEFGENNNYPELILVRQDGKVTKYIGRGKNRWGEIISWAKLSPPYNNNFVDVLKAIDEYEENVTKY